MQVLISEKIEGILMPLLQEMDLELIDLNITKHRNSVRIEVLADRQNGGITLDECSQLNKELNRIIECKNLIDGLYLLEVSSPGIDRVLKTTQDYKRAINRKIHLFLTEPIENKREYVGIIKNVEEQNIVLQVHSLGILIPINKINKAKQIV